jgi:hypothetical protein
MADVMTSSQMHEILARGGSVLWRGQLITRPDQIPSDAQVAEYLDDLATGRHLPDADVEGEQPPESRP